MACRVGITSNLERREMEQRMKYPSLRKWTILDRNLSYSEAQKKENEYAKEHNYESHPGGLDNGRKNWVVYRFDY